MWVVAVFDGCFFDEGLCNNMPRQIRSKQANQSYIFFLCEIERPIARHCFRGKSLVALQHGTTTAGGVTISHLRFGPEPIKGSYLIDAGCNYLAIHKKESDVLSTYIISLMNTFLSVFPYSFLFLSCLFILQSSQSISDILLLCDCCGIYPVKS